MQLLEPMRSLVAYSAYLKSNFGFTKIEEIIYIYKETRKKVDELFQSVYAEAVSLANELRKMVETMWTADKLE